jgi:hypothetical protein
MRVTLPHVNRRYSELIDFEHHAFDLRIPL